jgi:hypothetical protein
MNLVGKILVVGSEDDLEIHKLLSSLDPSRYEFVDYKSARIESLLRLKELDLVEQYDLMVVGNIPITTARTLTEKLSSWLPTVGFNIEGNVPNVLFWFETTDALVGFIDKYYRALKEHIGSLRDFQNYLLNNG